MDGTSKTLESKLPSLCRVHEVATHLRLSRSSIYSMMNSGALPYVQIGRTRRIRLDDVLAPIDSHTIDAGQN